MMKKRIGYAALCAATFCVALCGLVVWLVPEDDHLRWSGGYILLYAVIGFACVALLMLCRKSALALALMASSIAVFAWIYELGLAEPDMLLYRGNGFVVRRESHGIDLPRLVLFREEGMLERRVAETQGDFAGELSVGGLECRDGVVRFEVNSAFDGRSWVDTLSVRLDKECDGVLPLRVQ